MITRSRLTLIASALSIAAMLLMWIPTSEGASRISSFGLSTTRVTGGGDIGAKVVLSSPATGSGELVRITIDYPQISTAPTEIAISAGDTEGTFRILSKPVHGSIICRVQIRVGTNQSTKSFTVLPPALDSITLDTPTIDPGQIGRGTVRLTGPAPDCGVKVPLKSDKPDLIELPEFAIVPAGQSSGQFEFKARDPQQARLIAREDGKRSTKPVQKLSD